MTKREHKSFNGLRAVQSRSSVVLLRLLGEEKVRKVLEGMAVCGSHML